VGMQPNSCPRSRAAASISSSVTKLSTYPRAALPEGAGGPSTLPVDLTFRSVAPLSAPSG
jgi:hypothetical protein